VRTQLGDAYLSHLKNFDIIFRSPGIPYLLPELVRAKKQGVIISSSTKLFFEHCGAKIIGITGTKGKGTTTTLLYKILKAAKKDVFLAGNIGVPMLDILPKLTKKSIVILELSSFQLHDLDQSPSIAAILDVFPDHQDSHKNLAEYYAAKANIGKFQKKGDVMFFFVHQTMSKKLASKSPAKKFAVDERKFPLFRADELIMPGAHNYKNAVMAANIAQSLKIPRAIIRKVACAFSGNEHRLEFVRKVRGVQFYNDSASTNPQTTAAAIRAFPNAHKIIIAGGQDKGLEYTPLAHALKSSNASVVLFGENKTKIQKAIHNAGVPVVLVKNLKEAVLRAARIGREGDIVLFSPGAASFDMFKNYADRGTQFKKIVLEL
jgi:UDP-N-acetylmuramoylalanine--D-glutamate ligase